MGSGKLGIEEKAYVVEVKTGLHIGAGNDIYEIGQADNPVIKTRRSQEGVEEPYIPGSSLKGKIRSLLELSGYAAEDYDAAKGKECMCGACDVCKLFGALVKENNKQRGVPARALIRDAFLEEGQSPREVIEAKYETAIDRATGTARGGMLRSSERVVPGTRFRVQVVFRFFEGDDAEKLKETFQKGLELLEKDYLGGSGSRGYGCVSITPATGQNE